MNLKFLFPFLTLFFLASCAKDSTTQVDPRNEIEADEQLLPNGLPYELDTTTLTYLEPVEKSNSRTTYQNLVFTYADQDYKVKYEYKTSSGSWATLHPGQSFIKGNTSIPLTFATHCTRFNRFIVRTKTLFVGNPACMPFGVAVPHTGCPPGPACYGPGCPDPYVDIDSEILVAGTNYWNISSAAIGCADESYIIDGSYCMGSTNTYCN